MSKTIYVSIDVEADGPIPGVYSMLSIGAAAFRITGPDSYEQIDTFKRNILPLADATQHPNTMQWWAGQPKAWKASTEGAIEPEIAMPDFVRWLDALKSAHGGCSLALVGYPVTFDFQFVHWYVVRFTGFPTPYGFAGLDIKTLAAARLGCEYKDATKKRMPKRWFRDCPPHTHDAQEDAIGQGVLLMNMLLDKA